MNQYLPFSVIYSHLYAGNRLNGIIHRMNNGKKKKENKAAGQRLLLAAFNEQARLKAGQGSKRTAKNYRTTIAKIQTYLSETAGRSDMQLHDLDTHRVQDFVTWLSRQHPNAPGTVGFYLSNFKAMYNRAVRQGEVSYPDSIYPFACTTIKTPVPFKRALPQEEVQLLSEQNLYAQLSPACRESLELFLFILFCQGISFQDIYTLTYDQVTTSGHIIYTRSKTGVQLKVMLTDEMKHILKRHRKPGNPYLFPFLHERRKEKTAGELDEDSALKRTNRHLKKIGKLLRIKISLTTYVMRHTFATLMLSSGATIELISQCLGHTSIKTTQIYLSKLTTEKLDKATNKMIEMYIRQPGEQEETPPPPKRTPCRKKTTKSETPCQTKTMKEKKCPSLNKKRTFGDLTALITATKVNKTFQIKKLKTHSFFSVLHNIRLFFTKEVFQFGANNL